MEAAFDDFQKIRPYGNKGDGGNDGYRKKEGIYYQVYAPKSPQIKEKEASKKLIEDFNKLKKEWNEISKIKKYYFVYNDQYCGTTQLIEETITKLNKENKGIDFDIFLPKILEKVFFSLSEEDIISLGFNIDKREAILNAKRLLEKIENEYLSRK